MACSSRSTVCFSRKEPARLLLRPGYRGGPNSQPEPFIAMWREWHPASHTCAAASMNPGIFMFSGRNSGHGRATEDAGRSRRLIGRWSSGQVQGRAGVLCSGIRLLDVATICGDLDNWVIQVVDLSEIAWQNWSHWGESNCTRKFAVRPHL